MPQVQVLEKQPGFGEQLGTALGQGLSQGIGSALSDMLQRKQIERSEKDFINRGLPPALARLAAVAPIGGQTEIFKAALDEFKRSGNPSIMKSQGFQDLDSTQPFQESGSQTEIFPEQNNQQQFIDADLGLTPAERAKRESERYSSGLPIFQEISSKIKGFEGDKDRFRILENLNASDKLPKNLGRLNVDKEGNLRLPFAASPEAERFVKTLNEFSAGAKDTFGSRVTNFDLQQYLLRYPTLLNSKEGRRQLLQQMKLVNQINSTHYGALKKVYDQAGGIRKIDADVAERIAEKKSGPIIEKLRTKFDEIGTFETQPAASEFKGRKIRDKKTGEIFVSDGKNWIPEQ